MYHTQNNKLAADPAGAFLSRPIVYLTFEC